VISFKYNFTNIGGIKISFIIYLSSYNKIIIVHQIGKIYIY